MGDAEFRQLRDAISGRYDLEDLVGRGGMGAVYRARSRSLDSPVAVKVLPIPASLGADELARFRREAMLAARLPNPHIVPVFEFEIRDDLAYLVMPLIEGRSLASRLADEGPLSLADAQVLATQIGGALGFAHGRGIIHRDVKPANILWEPANRRWLITDFGIARPLQHSGDTITSAGDVLGTPAYMAPEQAAGRDLDGRADLYALAATLCEAVTGKRLKPMADPAEGAAAVRAARPDFPEPWIQALTAPLALKPDGRPPTAQAWLDRLAAADRRPRRRLLAAGLGLAALATIAGILPLALSPPAPPAPADRVIAVLPFVDGTGLGVGGELTAAFEDELRWVPDMQVVPAAAVAEAVGLTDLTTAGGRDSGVTRMLARFGATAVLAGSVTADGPDALRIAAQLHLADGSVTAAPAGPGPTDSLRALVTTIVLDLFEPAGGGGYRPALPGGGLAALSALRAGDSLFRASSYDAAIARYDRVLALDSTYALAAFKRTLAEVMRSQPTRATRAVRTALDPVQRYRDNLDPLNRELLRAYELLVTEGDVEAAHERVRDLTDRYPLAVDAWFIRGYLEFYFGPLFGTPPTTARWALSKVLDLDPGFALARGLLGWIALLEGDTDVARDHLRAYLALDSTSTWAALARLADSLRLRGDRVALGTLRRVEDRPTAALELFALAGGAMRLTHAERLVVGDAARELRDRATTAEERATAFRLQLGNALGSGRAGTVDTLFLEAPRRNVPRDELDRSAVLLAVTGLRQPRSDDQLEAALARLAADTQPDGLWLAARWFRDRDSTRARHARRALEALARGADGPSLLAGSLLGDLEAQDRFDAGNPTEAFRRWAEATRRYQFEEVPFGLVASLWPVRLHWARAAAATGDHAEVLLATATFEHATGFMDQAGRLLAVPLRADALDATGDRLAARDLRTRYADVLRDASGPWTALRDTLARLGAP